MLKLNRYKEYKEKFVRNLEKLIINRAYYMKFYTGFGDCVDLSLLPKLEVFSASRI